MENPSICYVVYRYRHHSPHSGYSRLAEFGQSEFNGEVIKVDKPLPRSIIRERMLWRLANGTPGYDRAAMAAELKVAWRILNEQGCIYHFLYGETTYHYAGYLNNFRRNRLVASFHQPPVGIQKAVQIDWHIRQLSALVCVGRNQQEYFAEIFDRDRVFFVPLGVDVDFYSPPESFDDRDPNLCIFVGDNYRDFPTLRGVIELVADKRPKTKFVGILPSRRFEAIGVHPNLSLRSKVHENDLLDLYHSASIMIMPFHQATANNAILEGMACGLPLIVSDVGAIRDYVNPKGSILIKPYDSQSMARSVLDLLGEPQERRRMSVKSREQAIKFRWSEVVKQLQQVYAAVA